MADRAVIGVSNKLPDFFHPEKGSPIPDELIGATIISFGAPIGGRFEGGGLVVDYRLKDGTDKRMVLEFTETGMWISYLGNKSGHSG